MSTTYGGPKPRRLPKELTGRQQAFVREYLVDYNGTQAAIRAGYAKRSAAVEACRQLRNAKVQAELLKRGRPIKKKAELKASALLENLMTISFGDPRSFVNEHGRLKRLDQLDDAAAHMVASFEVHDTNLTKVKLKDGMKATELLMKTQGLLREQMSIERSGELTVAEEERIKEFTDEELAEFREAVKTVNRLLQGEA